MADDPKPTEAVQKPMARFTRTKDFRVTYANTFRIRLSAYDIGIAFGYQTEIPNDQAILQDEVEVVLTPLIMKVLRLALEDTVEAIEKAIGVIQLPQEVVEAVAAAKAKATAEAENLMKQKPPPPATAG
jgi:hypothetical protein